MLVGLSSQYLHTAFEIVFPSSEFPAERASGNSRASSQVVESSLNPKGVWGIFTDKGWGGWENSAGWQLVNVFCS
jgi:hypothetical protein